jgi:ribosome assembly protein YihI (activator of Der GTPase)
MSLSANSFLFPVVVLRRCAPPLQKAAALNAVARKAQKAAARKAQKSGARKAQKAFAKQAQKAFAKKAQKVGAMKEVWAMYS